MAKTLTPDTKPQSSGKRKKQAKQEAKAMLKVEQAKKDVQKAEQKAAKVQARLEEKRTRLHNLELRLDQMRAPQQSETPQESQPLTIESAQHNGATQAGQELSFTDTPALDLPPSAPASDDIATSQVTDQAVSEEQGTPQVVDAEASSTSESAEGSANDEVQYLTEAESDTTTEPTGEWGDTAKHADLFTDTDLSEGSLSPEDEVVYHRTDDVVASDATPATHEEEHAAALSNNEHTSDDTANSETPATSGGN